eukprot:g9420.t1
MAVNPFPQGYAPSPERLSRVRDIGSVTTHRTLIPQQLPTHKGFNPHINYFTVKRGWSKERLLARQRSKERRENASTPCGACFFFLVDKLADRFPHLYHEFLFPPAKKPRETKKNPASNDDENLPRGVIWSWATLSFLPKDDHEKHSYAATLLCVFRVAVTVAMFFFAFGWQAKKAGADELFEAGCYIESFEVNGCHVPDGQCALIISVFTKDKDASYEQGRSVFTGEKYLGRHFWPEMSTSFYARDGEDLEGEGLRCCKATSCCGFSTTTTSTTPEPQFDSRGRMIVVDPPSLLQAFTEWPRTFCDNWGSLALDGTTALNCNSNPWPCYYEYVEDMVKKTVHGLRYGVPDYGEIELLLFAGSLVAFVLTFYRVIRDFLNALLQDLFGIFCCCLFVDVDEDGNVIRGVEDQLEKMKREKHEKFKKQFKHFAEEIDADSEGDVADAGLDASGGNKRNGASRKDSYARAEQLTFTEKYDSLGTIPDSEPESGSSSDGEVIREDENGFLVVAKKSDLKRQLEYVDPLTQAKNDAKKTWLSALYRLNSWARKKPLTQAKLDEIVARKRAQRTKKKAVEKQEKLQRERRKRETKIDKMLRLLREKHGIGSSFSDGEGKTRGRTRITGDMLMRPILKPLETTWDEKLAQHKKIHGRTVRKIHGLLLERDLYKHVQPFKYDPAFSRHAKGSEMEKGVMALTATFNGTFSQVQDGSLPTLLESSFREVGPDGKFLLRESEVKRLREREAERKRLEEERRFAEAEAERLRLEEIARAEAQRKREEEERKEIEKKREEGDYDYETSAIQRKLQSIGSSERAEITRQQSRAKIALLKQKSRANMSSSGSEYSSSRSSSVVSSRNTSKEALPARGRGNTKGRLLSTSTTSAVGVINSPGSSKSAPGSVLKKNSKTRSPAFARSSLSRASIAEDASVSFDEVGGIIANSLSSTSRATGSQSPLRKVRSTRFESPSPSPTGATTSFGASSPNSAQKLLSTSATSENMLTSMLSSTQASGVSAANTSSASRFLAAFGVGSKQSSEKTGSTFTFNKRSSTQSNATEEHHQNPMNMSMTTTAGGLANLRGLSIMMKVRKKLQGKVATADQIKARTPGVSKVQGAIIRNPFDSGPTGERPNLKAQILTQELNPSAKKIEKEFRRTGKIGVEHQNDAYLWRAMNHEDNLPFDCTNLRYRPVETAPTAPGKKSKIAPESGKRSASPMERGAKASGDGRSGDDAVVKATTSSHSVKKVERVTVQSAGEAFKQSGLEAPKGPAARHHDDEFTSPLQPVRGCLHVPDYDRRLHADAYLFRKQQEKASAILSKRKQEHYKHGPSNAHEQDFAQGYRLFLKKKKPDIDPEVYDEAMATDKRDQGMEAVLAAKAAREAERQKKMMDPISTELARKFKMEDAALRAEMKDSGARKTYSSSGSEDGMHGSSDISGDDEGHGRRNPAARPYLVPVRPRSNSQKSLAAEASALSDPELRVAAMKDLGKLSYEGYRAADLNLFPSRVGHSATTSRLLAKQRRKCGKKTIVGRVFENPPHRDLAPGEMFAEDKAQRIRNGEEFWDFTEEMWRRQREERAAGNYASDGAGRKKEVSGKKHADEVGVKRITFPWEAGSKLTGQGEDYAGAFAGREHENRRRRDRARQSSDDGGGSGMVVKLPSAGKKGRYVEDNAELQKRVNETEEEHFIRVRSIQPMRKRGALYGNSEAEQWTRRGVKKAEKAKKLGKDVRF